MSCAWKNKNCKIGVILGTGSNACYVERATNAEMFTRPNIRKDAKVVINLEWGPFGEKSKSLDNIRTHYDIIIDEKSTHPKQQLFEKLISGMYLGEIARRIIIDFIHRKILFKGIISEDLAFIDSFKTEFISRIEEKDEKECYYTVRSVLYSLGYNNISDEDCLIVRFICECVSTRSIHLVASAISVLLLKIGEENVTVGIDGSLYRFHPHYHRKLTNKIRELIPKNYKFELMLSEDGSGRGGK